MCRVPPWETTPTLDPNWLESQVQEITKRQDEHIGRIAHLVTTIQPREALARLAIMRESLRIDLEAFIVEVTKR